MANDAAVQDNASWNVNPLGIVVGSDYADFEKSLKAQLDKIADKKGAALIARDKGMYGTYISDPANIAYSYKSPSVSDASVGGNDVMNPLAAFNENDDIIHNIFTTNQGQQFGMGRVYSEMYDSRQQVVYFTMGIPKYRNLQTWLKNATKKELAELNEEGKISAWSKLGDLIKGGLKLAIELPWLPAIWAYKVVSNIKTYPVTEYFAFRETMPLYYRYVNTILCHLAVNMGIASTGGGNGQNVPDIIKNGPDIFRIMSKRALRLGGGTNTDTDSELQKVKNYVDNPNEKIGGLSGFWTGLTTGALEGGNFIGWRVDKSESGETFSNSTQDSSLAAKLNEAVQSKRDASSGEMGGKGIAAMAMRWGKQISGVKKAIQNFTSGGGLESAIAYLAAGNGYFDLPKQWGGSGGMSRSINLTMKLRSKTGGDPVSIYQSIMIPIAMLLAMSLPRAVGDSTYTSPFIVRVFSKGMFAIPAGIVSSLSITRGSGDFGWAVSKLPTVADVSISIDDLSPMLFLSMGGTGVFAQAFSNNTKLHEYLGTLAALGLKERHFRLGQLKRQIAAAALVARNTAFSPIYRGYVMGNSSIVRTIMSLTPYHRVPNN